MAVGSAHHERPPGEEGNLSYVLEKPECLHDVCPACMAALARKGIVGIFYEDGRRHYEIISAEGWDSLYFGDGAYDPN